MEGKNENGACEDEWGDAWQVASGKWQVASGKWQAYSAFSKHT